MSQMASTLWDKLTNIIPNGNILQLTSSKKGLFVECLTLVWRVWLATVHLTTGLMLEPESCRPSMIRTRTWNSSTCVMYGYAKQVYIGCLKLNWLRLIGGSLLTSWFTFLLICIRTLHTEGSMLDINWLQEVKELVKLNACGNIWLFLCNIQGEIVFQNLQNLWVAKSLMSSYILCKILSF